ncbi:hypothetical protein DXG01_005016 [Tephrocybe rancida]|nr:hypothetical protein DXG01_005016 [Tephrocybe rancida]
MPPGYGYVIRLNIDTGDKFHVGGGQRTDDPTFKADRKASSIGAKILAAANQFVSLGLKDVGYEYVNIDDCWSSMARDSATKKIVPDPTKFPNGIASLATQIHALGLKIGIYGDAGTATCAGFPGSLGTEALDAATFNDWGIDYLKYASMNSVNGLSAALAAQPRPIQFEICDWGAANVWDWGAKVGHSWRMSGDSSATWSYITSIITTNVAHLSATTFYSHNDMDMMEIGNGALTIAEQRTHFAAWAFLKSPILLGTDLSRLNSTQLAIVKNKELLAFHQDATIGTAAAPFKATSSAPTTSPPEYYSGASSKGTHVLIINTASSTATKTFTLSNVPGLGTSGTWKVHDMWTGTDLSGTYAASASFSVSVAAHDSVAYLLTKALTCLSKYGDELSMHAMADSLSLSATNSSKSAYCRFKYERLFFSKYSVSAPGEAWANDFEQAADVTGQLLTKSLLSILKHRTVEKAVERCEMSIVDGGVAGEDEPSRDNQDELETRLIVRLHCQHGVIKTHRLILLAPTSLMAPGIPEAINESSLTIGPRALKDMIEHFPLARGVKSDPQLIWSFGDAEVELRSLESSLDAKGKAQLATELTISAEEFDVYNIFAPTTIAFHLREFNQQATIAYADSMSLSIDLRFTDPAAPLFMDVEGDSSESLFVISTSQVHGAVTCTPSQKFVAPNAKKRGREETPLELNNKKPMKAVHRIDARTTSMPPSSMPRSASHALPASQGFSNVPHIHRTSNDAMPPPPFVPQHPQKSQKAQQEPLFLPSSSQLSAADEEVLRSTGLGIETMDADELAELLDGEGEEVAFDFASQDPNYQNFLERPLASDQQRPESFELEDDAAEIPPTQNSEDAKMFRALFED